MGMGQGSDEIALRALRFVKYRKNTEEPNRMMKHPFIDPGSVYEGNLWDWDSFWASYALLNLATDSDQGEGKRSVSAIIFAETFSTFSTISSPTATCPS